MQGKLKETFKKQYKLTTWVEVQTRYKTVWVIRPWQAIPDPMQVPYEYRIFHTKLVNKGLGGGHPGRIDRRPMETVRDFSGYLGRQTLPVQRRLAARWLRWLRRTGH